MAVIAGNFLREIAGRDYWGHQDVDGRIILRWIFRKWEGVVGTGWSWLRKGTGGRRLCARWWTFGFHKMRRISWLAAKPVAYQEGLCSMKQASSWKVRLVWSVLQSRHVPIKVYISLLISVYPINLSRHFRVHGVHIHWKRDLILSSKVTVHSQEWISGRFSVCKS